MGLQDETRVRVWLAAISPLPKNQQIFGDPDRPCAKLVRLILSKCNNTQLLYYQKRFYNNAAKIFGMEGVLCRRLESLEKKMVYIACGSGCIITTSAWLCFFEKSFRVPKVVPKIF